MIKIIKICPTINNASPIPYINVGVFNRLALMFGQIFKLENPACKIFK